MKIALLHSVKHQGRHYRTGDVLEVTEAVANGLFDKDAAEPTFDFSTATNADATLDDPVATTADNPADDAEEALVTEDSVPDAPADEVEASPFTEDAVSDAPAATTADSPDDGTEALPGDDKPKKKNA